MNTKKIVLAALAGTALLAASGAQAHDRWGHGRHGHYYRPVPQRVVVLPAPYYAYPAAPVYYAPRPQVYAPAPVVYGQIPLGHRAGISFQFPL